MLKKKIKKTVKKTTKKISIKKSGKKPTYAKVSAFAKASADKSAGKEKLTLVGVVTHYYDKIKVAIFKVKSPIQVGQKLRFANTEGTIFEQPIISMQINHESVKKVKKGVVIGMKVKKQVHENNKVYLIK
jgi:cellobiose-specific phosphotransferase system component IIB